MYQIKIFEGHGNNEADVNAWLRDRQYMQSMDCYGGGL
jgi:hypothetical protein